MRWLIRAWWALIRFGFRLLYNELAWTYDLVSRVVSLGQWRSWQRTAIPHLDAPPGAIVLELAHGTGDLQIDLTRNGLTAFALDVSRAMGRIARRKLARHGMPARLVRADDGRIPFPDESVRAVVSTFPTDFILRPDVLAEAYRVLEPGGRLVVVLNGVLTLKSAPARALEWLYRVTGQREPWPVSAASVFEAAGFHVQRHVEELPNSAVLLLVARKAKGE